MNRTDIEYVLHCVKNASELISQDESEKAKGLLLSGELLLSEKLKSDNNDYAKCPCCDSPWNIGEHDSCSCGAFIAKRA